MATPEIDGGHRERYAAGSRIGPRAGSGGPNIHIAGGPMMRPINKNRTCVNSRNAPRGPQWQAKDFRHILAESAGHQTRQRRSKGTEPMHRHQTSDPACFWCRITRLDALLWNDQFTRYGLMVLTVLVGLLLDRLLFRLAA